MPADGRMGQYALALVGLPAIGTPDEIANDLRVDPSIIKEWDRQLKDVEERSELFYRRIVSQMKPSDLLALKENLGPNASEKPKPGKKGK